MFAFACTEKLNGYQEQIMTHFYTRCLQSEDIEDELALNIPDVRVHVYDCGQVFAFACTEKLLSRIKHKTFYPEQPKCLRSLKWIFKKDVF